MKEVLRQEPLSEQAEHWTLEQRHPIFGATWLTTMAISLRRTIIFPAQKLAQAATVAMLLAIAAEIRHLAYKYLLQNMTPNSAKSSGKVRLCKDIDSWPCIDYFFT